MNDENTDPDILPLLRDGRAKLERQRLDEKLAEADRNKAEWAKNLAHLEGLREAAASAFPACLHRHLSTEYGSLPDKWHWRVDLWRVEALPDGFTVPVLANFVHAKGVNWQQARWQYFNDRAPGSWWAVPVWAQLGEEVFRAPEASWHYTDDIRLALALAEEESHKKADLEERAQACREKDERREAQQVRVRQQPSLGERLVALIREAVQEGE